MTFQRPWYEFRRNRQILNLQSLIRSNQRFVSGQSRDSLMLLKREDTPSALLELDLTGRLFLGFRKNLAVTLLIHPARYLTLAPHLP